MDRDGTRAGFDIPLTRAISDAVPVPVIAYGGVGALDHLVEGIRDGGATAVLAASIFHFGDQHDRRGEEAHGGGWHRGSNSIEPSRGLLVPRRVSESLCSWRR